MAKLRVALLGAGDQAERWAAALDASATVVRAQGDELPDHDALVVAPGAGDCFRQVKDALAAGKPVLYAAPYLFSPWQAALFDALSRRQGGLLRIAEPFQHEGAVRLLQRLTRGREPLWRLRYLRTTSLLPAEGRIDQFAIEDMALCQSLIDMPPIAVMATVAQLDEMGGVCAAFVNVQYPLGVVAQCTISLAEHTSRREVTAVTSSRTATIDRLDALAPLQVSARSDEGETARRSIPAPASDPIADEARRFLEASATGDRSAANSKRWARVAALWWAARQSMSFGGSVNVPEPAVALAAQQTAPPLLRVIEGGGESTRTTKRPQLTVIAS